MVDVVRMELGDAERREARLGLKAVRRRRREPLVLRRGVKDWKRLVRLEEGIVVVVLVVEVRIGLGEVMRQGNAQGVAGFNKLKASKGSSGLAAAPANARHMSLLALSPTLISSPITLNRFIRYPAPNKCQRHRQSLVRYAHKLSAGTCRQQHFNKQCFTCLKRPSSLPRELNPMQVAAPRTGPLVASSVLQRRS
jgi:hypothetical protein